MTETEERSVSKGLGLIAAMAAISGGLEMPMLRIEADAFDDFTVAPRVYQRRKGPYQPNQGPLTDAQVKAMADHDKRCAKGKRAKLRKRK